MELTIGVVCLVVVYGLGVLFYRHQCIKKMRIYEDEIQLAKLTCELYRRQTVLMRDQLLSIMTDEEKEDFFNQEKELVGEINE